MNNATDLSPFVTEKSKNIKKENSLIISEGFIKEFDLHAFLIKFVLGESFELEKEGLSLTINNSNELLEVIVKYLKAKEYIGVGVGGIYITNNISGSEEHVLLYKRYHPVEDQMWSILGGSSKMHEKIEDTLKRKISRITNISRDSIVVKDIIRANNHEEENYHYLSPAFYVDITNPTSYLFWGKQKNTNGKKKKVAIIRDVTDFMKLGKSTYECPLLAWVPVDMINGRLTDSNGDQIFTFTTLQAIERHRHIRDATMQIVKATETVKSYQDWRIRQA